MTQDLRYVARSLTRARAYGVAVLVTLILASLTASTVWVATYEVLLKPLPFRDPSTLVRIVEENPQAGLHGQNVSPGSFANWVDHSRTLEHLALFSIQETVIRRDRTLYSARVASVSPAFFGVLGVGPELGRTLSAESNVSPRSAGEILLSYSAWVRWFGSSPQALGQVVWLDGTRPFTVVGVMPERIAFPAATDAWRLEMLPATIGKAFRAIRAYGCVGRLRAAGSIDQTRSELAELEQALAEQYPSSNHGWTTTVERLDASLLAPLASRLTPLALFVGGFLLICVCNVTYLQTARSLSRRAEMNLRVAVGATRRRLAQLVATELLFMALPAAIVTIIMGEWLFHIVLGLVPTAIVTLQEVRYGPTGWLIGGALPFIVGLPAFAAGVMWQPYQSGDRGASRSIVSGHRWFGRALIVTQCALTVSLLIASMLLVQTLRNLLRADLGFQPNKAVSAGVTIPRGAVTGGRPWPQLLRIVESLTGDAAALPGTEAAGAVTRLPLSPEASSGLVWLASSPREDRRSRLPDPNYQWKATVTLITPDYFHAIGMNILLGRGFNSADRLPDAQLIGQAERPMPGSAIVNEAFASRYASSQAMLGASLVLLDAENFAPTWTVVGVVNDSASRSTASDAEPTVFIPFAQAPSTFRLQLVVKSRDDAQSASQALSRGLRARHSQLLVGSARPLTEVVEQSRMPQTLLTNILVCCAAIALVVAMCGIYGTVGLAVLARTDELAVRMALGASRARASSVVVAHALAPVVVGSLVGATSYLGVEKILAAVIVTSSSTALLTAAGAPVCVLAAAGIAVAPVVLRTLRIDVARLLRHEH